MQAILEVLGATLPAFFGALYWVIIIGGMVLAVKAWDRIEPRLKAAWRYLLSR